MLPRYRKFQIVGIAGALIFSAVVLTDTLPSIHRHFLNL